MRLRLRRSHAPGGMIGLEGSAVQAIQRIEPRLAVCQALHRVHSIARMPHRRPARDVPAGPEADIGRRRGAAAIR